MNVAGAGLAGAAGVLIFLFGLMPLVIILILSNLKVFSELDRPVRRGAKIFIYLFFFVIQYCATFLLTRRFLDVFGYFSFYLLFLLFFTYIFKNVQGSSVKKPLIFVSVITVFALAGILIVTKPKEMAVNKFFLKQFEQAMKLRLLATDSLYSTLAITIKNDTVAGFYEEPQKEHYYNEHPFKCYFIQSLKNLKYKKIIDVTGSNGYTYKLNYSNGAIYVDGTSYDNLARMIYPDGTESEGYRDSLIGSGRADSRIIYKNKLIITSGNSFVVFDSSTEKKLFGKNNAQYFGQINNCLVFTSAAHDTLTVSCLDLDKLKIRWVKTLFTTINGVNGSLQYSFEDLADRNISTVDIPTDKGVLIFDLITGAVKNNYPLPAASDRGYYYQADGKNNYISTDSVLQCLSNDGKEKWRVSGMSLLGIFNDRVIALTQDNKKYLVLNKDNGHVIASVSDPGPRYRVRVYGKYLIVNADGSGRLYE